MNKIFNIVTVALIFLTSSLVHAQELELGNYVPGDVIVGFHDNVSEEEANALIESYNLVWESHFPKMFSYWVKVSSGYPEYFIDDFIYDLEASDIVLWAKVRGNPEGEPGANYILVQFNTSATQETAQELINSFEGLEVSSILTAPKWDVVNVPVGQELQWIETFESENIVKYAELNGIGTVTGTGSSHLLYVAPIGTIILIVILFLLLKKKQQVRHGARIHQNWLTC